MDKKNILMVSIIVVCVVILVALGINAFASTGGNVTSYVSGGSCTGGDSCSPADRAACGSASSCAPKTSSASVAPSGCGSSASGGCGSAASAGGCGSAAPSIDFGRLEAEAVSYYTSQTGETGITAKAYNTAEGIEVAIIKDQKIIDTLSYGIRK